MGLPLWNPPRRRLPDCLVAVFDVSTIGFVANAVVDAYEVLISLPSDLFSTYFSSIFFSRLDSLGIWFIWHLEHWLYIRLMQHIFQELILSRKISHWCRILIEETNFLFHLVIYLLFSLFSSLKSVSLKNEIVFEFLFEIVIVVRLYFQLNRIFRPCLVVCFTSFFLSFRSQESILWKFMPMAVV